jgi:hypothetical protein
VFIVNRESGFLANENIDLTGNRYQSVINRYVRSASNLVLTY